MTCMLEPDGKFWKQKDLCLEALVSCTLFEKLCNPTSIRLSLSMLATGNWLPVESTWKVFCGYCDPFGQQVAPNLFAFI